MLNLILPTIKTKRLIIRPIKLEDANDLYVIASDKRVNDYLSYPLHKSLDETKQVIDKYFLNRPANGIPQTYVLVYKENNKMIGTCDFVSIRYHDVGEIGYSLNYDYWNQGLMSEALKEVINVGFAHVGLRKIEIKHSVNNKASQRVIEKTGFIYEGTLRKLIYDKLVNDYVDCKTYGILKAEWRQIYEGNGS